MGRLKTVGELVEYVRLVDPLSGVDDIDKQDVTYNAFYKKDGISLEGGIPIRALALYLWQSTFTPEQRDTFVTRFLDDISLSSDSYRVVLDGVVFQTADDLCAWAEWKHGVISVSTLH